MASAIPTALDIIQRVFQRYHLQLNFAAGKTEAIVRFAGKGAHPARASIVHADSTLTVALAGGAKCRVVHQYKHVGSLVTGSGSPKADARARVGKAKAAFNPFARRLFKSPEVGLKQRLQLFEAMVMSTLLYGVDSWVSISQVALGYLEQFQMHALRRTTGTNWTDDKDQLWTDQEVRDYYDVESIESRVRRRRLAAAASLVRTPFDDLSAFLEAWGPTPPLQASAGVEQTPHIADALLDDLRAVQLAADGDLDYLGDPWLHWPGWLVRQ